MRVMEQLILTLQADLQKETSEKNVLVERLANCQDQAVLLRAKDTVQGRNDDMNRIRIAELEDELRKERDVCIELQGRIETLQHDQDTSSSCTSIPRPKGTAGQDWSIQVEMGLADSSKKTAIYQGLQRQIRDLALGARLNWESNWADIPAGDKGKFFQVAREQNPFLKRFYNDWATEEIVKQYFKNKRKNHYKNGWLEVPERYKYLKENSSRRDASKSRQKHAKATLAARKQQRLRSNVNSRNLEGGTQHDENGGGNEWVGLE